MTIDYGYADAYALHALVLLSCDLQIFFAKIMRKRQSWVFGFNFRSTVLRSEPTMQCKRKVFPF